MDHRIQRPRVYRTAAETALPGYLAARFRALRTEQARAARNEAASALEVVQKVRTMPKRGSV